MQFYLLIGAVTFLWGLSFPSIKVGLAHIEPFTFLWLRSLISAIAIFGFILIRRGPIMPPAGGRRFG